MTDIKELRAIAMESALKLAAGKSKTAEEVVKDAETIHEFLVLTAETDENK